MSTAFQIQVAQTFGIFSRGQKVEQLSPNVVRVSCGCSVVEYCSVFNDLRDAWEGRWARSVGGGNLMVAPFV